MSLCDRLIAGVLSGARWLALPVAALLFLQWPLRDVVQAYSRDANDLGQWLFALYVAASVTAATRARAHIASDAIAAGYPGWVRAALGALGIAAGLAPWCLVVLWAGLVPVWQSVRSAERFPDTGNPGYFIVKSALVLLLVLVVAQALVDLVGGRRETGEEPRP